MNLAYLQRNLLARVNGFLAAYQKADSDVADLLEGARDQALAYRSRLETPVRVAFAGKTEAGKASLINLLIGENVLPEGPDAVGLPTMIVRHSTVERTIASWWDQPNVEFKGRDLAAAAALGPDVITFEINCEELSRLWLVDIAGFDDEESTKQAIFALIRLADVMVWCSRAANPVLAAESTIWRNMPGRLIRNSLLVLTDADNASEDEASAMRKRLTPDRIQNFRDVIPISTDAAMGALLAGSDDFEEVWNLSGASHLVDAVLSLALEVRKADLERIERGVEQHLAQAEEMLEITFVPLPMDRSVTRKVSVAPKKAQPVVTAGVAVAKPAAETPAPAVPATGAGAPKPATPVAKVASKPEKPAAATSQTPKPATKPRDLAGWRGWVTRIGSLVEGLQSGVLADSEAFITAAQMEVDAFLSEMKSWDTPLPTAEHLVEEFEQANDLLILMQFESSDSAAREAAWILVQLGESLGAGYQE